MTIGIKMILQIIKSIRPINLLVITLTFIVLKLLDINSRDYIPENFLLHSIQLKFLIVSTILIAAAGYLINDFYDKEIDLVNKPKQKEPLGKPILLIGYITLNLIALIISFSFAPTIDIFMVFPGSIILLWLYSYKLKGFPFIGNFSIAILSATIPVIYFITMDSNRIDCQTPFPQIAASELILIFSVLAFFGTLSREIVKDIEDIKGDSIAGLKTIPILFGISTAKVFSILFLMFTLIILALVIKEKDYFNFSITSLITVGLLGFTPLLLAVLKTFQGTEKKHFKQAGNLIKLSMFGFLTFIYIHAITL